MPELNMPKDRIYLEFGATTVIVGYSGLAAMPVAAGLDLQGPTHRFCQLNSPVSFKVISWAATCMAGNPQCPHPDTGSSNDVLLAFVVGGGMPAVALDGTPGVRAFGQYLYALRAPFRLGVDPIILGRQPFVNVAGELNRINPTDFVRGLLGITPQLASEAGVPQWPTDLGRFIGR